MREPREFATSDLKRILRLVEQTMGVDHKETRALRLELERREAESTIKRGPKPKFTQAFTIWITPEQEHAVRTEAEERGITRTDVVRGLIEEWIKEKAGEDRKTA